MSDYYEKLVDNQLDRLSSINPSASSSQRALDLAKGAIMDQHRQANNAGILTSPITRLAVAATIIIAICLGIIFVNSKSQTTPDKQIVNPDNTDSTIANANNDNQHQLAELDAMYAAGDIEGLISKLTEDNMTIAAAAAAHLAKTTDIRAIEPLTNLAAKWQGDTENPFEKALEQIQSNIDQQGDTTKNTSSVQDNYNTPPEPNSLNTAGKKKEYERPQNIYFTEEQVMPDGTSIKAHLWISLPDLFKEHNDERTVIDNGIKRLTLDHKKKTALFEDSWHSVKPPEKHHYFQSAEAFRKELPDFIKAEINPKESTRQLTAYDLEATIKIPNKPDRIDHGKLWVHADSMLIAKTERLNPDNDPNIGPFLMHTSTVEYSPIPDSIFQMTVPPGYKKLGHKENPTFSGQVIDQQGNPVAGAKVYMKASGMPHTVDGDKIEIFTDSEGFFAFALPPNSEGIFDRDPICIWAFVEDDPDHIAWTLIRSEKAMKNEKGRMALAGPIPPHHGKLEICERYGKRGPWLKSASGIVLQMEESGTIFGSVKDSLGNSIANARVCVRFTIRNKLGHQTLYGPDLWQTIVNTDDQGNYIVNWLPKLWKTVTWDVTASADGYNSKTSSIRSTAPLDKIQTDLELLLTGITVTGTLVDNYGTLLDGRNISVDAGNGNARQTGKTDAKGKFEIKDCPITDMLKVTAGLNQNSYPSHLTEKYASFVYYPQVSKEIVTTDGKFVYEVNLVAELPELTVEVKVVDSSGQPLPYFPVEIRSSKSDLPTEWKRAKLLKRTDENGYCKITNVPSVQGLEVVLYGNMSTQFDNEYDEVTRKLIVDLRKEYSDLWQNIPVEIIEGQKVYKLRGVPLTNQQRQQQIKKQNL